jgi:Ca-activated chloride channel family protein
VGRVYAGGGTNLGGGLRRGIDSLSDRSGEYRQRKVILISDGLANHGITDPGALGRMAAGAMAYDASVSTVGVGYDFNEVLMTTIADHGAGSYYFLENPRAFARVFEKELESARHVAASSIEIRVPLGNGCRLIDAGGYPVEVDNGVAVIRPGDLMSGQTRKLFLTYRVPTDRAAKIDLGTVSVRYQSDGGPHRVSGEKRLSLACVADEKAVLSSIDREAWGEQVVKEDYSRLREAVAADIRTGKKEKALEKIRAYEADRRTINRSVGSAAVKRNLDHDVRNLRRSVEDAFDGAPAEVEQKQKAQSKMLQYESYKSRRDKQ